MIPDAMRHVQECFNGLLDVAKGYEAWEAELIESEEAWGHDEYATPVITQDLWDKLINLQTLRNEVLRKIRRVKLGVQYERTDTGRAGDECGDTEAHNEGA
jgi:hypothetical protein